MIFNAWNSYHGGIYTFCEDICGSNYRNNLDICAEVLSSVFKRLKNEGYTNSTQMMAMAATAWNGCSCGHTYYCTPWAGSGGINIPDIDQLTQYGASAGYLFSHSGYVGTGVFDTNELLPSN